MTDKRLSDLANGTLGDATLFYGTNNPGVSQNSFTGAQIKAYAAGATIPATTNLIQGDGAGNGADSGITTTGGRIAIPEPVTITAANANALSVGLNGTTNPALNVDSSTASSATGLNIKSNVALSGVTLSATSSASSEILNLASLGSGTLNLLVGAVNKLAIANTSNTHSNVQHVFNCTAFPTASVHRMVIIPNADTLLTAGTEAVHTYWNLAVIRQHASNTAITIQRDFQLLGSTHTFATAGGVITDTATLGITLGNGGANGTFTNYHGVLISSGSLTNVTNGYGATFNAPTGATNSYAAQFLGATRLAPVAAPTGRTGGELWNDSTQLTEGFNAAGNNLYRVGAIFAQSTAASIAVSTTASLLGTGVGSTTLAANSVAPGKAFLINGGGVYTTTASPGNLTINVTIGSVTIATATITNLGSALTSKAFMYTAEIQVSTTGSTGNVYVNGFFAYESGVLFAARSQADLNNGGALSGSIDFTAPQAINISVTTGAGTTVVNTTARVTIVA